MFDEYTYKEDVALFKKVLSTEADKILSDENLAVVFIGRETCPYCRKFAKKLSGLVHKVNTPIYYINSADTSDEGIASFREKYNIATVPGFIVRKNGEVEVRCDSSTPEDKILEMIK